MSTPFNPAFINTGPSHLIKLYVAANAIPLSANEAINGSPSPWKVFARTPTQAMDRATRLNVSVWVRAAAVIDVLARTCLLPKLFTIIFGGDRESEKKSPTLLLTFDHADPRPSRVRVRVTTRDRGTRPATYQNYDAVLADDRDLFSNHDSPNANPLSEACSMPYFPQKQEENVMSNTEFKPLTHGSKDIVLAAHYNVYGKRLVTGGADHRIRVFEKNQEDKWETFEVWKAHNAQVLDVCCENQKVDHQLT
jgi:hypothetical protein